MFLSWRGCQCTSFTNFGVRETDCVGSTLARPETTWLFPHATMYIYISNCLSFFFTLRAERNLRPDQGVSKVWTPSLVSSGATHRMFASALCSFALPLPVPASPMCGMSTVFTLALIECLIISGYLFWEFVLLDSKCHQPDVKNKGMSRWIATQTSQYHTSLPCHTRPRWV